MNHKFPYEVDWDGARGNVKQKLNLLTYANTTLTLIEQKSAQGPLRPKIGKTKEELQKIIAGLLKARKMIYMTGLKLNIKAL